MKIGHAAIRAIGLVLFCTICSTQIKAQTLNYDKNRYYEFIVECPIFKCNILGKITDTSLYVAPPGSKFILVDLRQDLCIIRFTFFSKNHSSKSKRKTDTEDYTTYSYYTISRPQLDFKTAPLKKSDWDLVVGSVVTPIKVRFGPFDFSKDITLGSTFGLKYVLDQDKQAAIDWLVGMGVSTVTLDSASTYGRTIKNVDLLAFTPSLGIVLEVGNAQIGIFLGFDFISNVNQIKYDWHYQSKPWISFGIGYAMFSFNLKKN